MKFPKVRKLYCPNTKCRRHRNFKVSQYKSGKATLHVQGKRRYDMKQKGFGGQTKPVFKKKKKTTKKISVKNKCVKCGYTILTCLKRAKTFELIDDKQRKKGSRKDVVYGA